MITMGLKVSHGAFEASCKTFNVFRRFVCRSIGGSYPPHEKPGLDGGCWYWDPNGPFSSKTHQGMKEFLSHSDSEGAIAPEWCEVIADDLEAALPYIAALEEKEPAYGQLAAMGGYVQTTNQFIEGCRLAYESNELLVFS